MEHKKKKILCPFLSVLIYPSLQNGLFYIKTDQIGDFFIAKIKDMFRSKFTPQIDHPVALCYARTRAITLILV